MFAMGRYIIVDAGKLKLLPMRLRCEEGRLPQFHLGHVQTVVWAGWAVKALGRDWRCVGSGTGHSTARGCRRDAGMAVLPPSSIGRRWLACPALACGLQTGRQVVQLALEARHDLDDGGVFWVPGAESG